MVVENDAELSALRQTTGKCDWASALRFSCAHNNSYASNHALLRVLPGRSPHSFAQTSIPEWCRALPRPEYKALERVPVSDPWFEVYKPAPGVFAIYEPHQAEETIGYLIVGEKRALLFDTGMGISDIKKITAELTKLPIIVLNSHTHDDHVGGNWEFDTVYGMDTDFTRKNAQGSREDAQAEITPDQICGTLPKGFDAKAYATRPWKITAYMHDGDRIDLGGRTIEVIATPGHTPDAISLIDRANGLLFTGDTYYPAPIWLFRPETDLNAYAASIRRLAALAPQRQARSGRAQYSGCVSLRCSRVWWRHSMRCARARSRQRRILPGKSSIRWMTFLF